MNIGYNSSLANLANPKVRRQKFTIGTLIFMMLLGAAFAGGGFLLLKNSSIDASWTRVQGKIVSSSSSINDGKTIYIPVVEYAVSGQTYRITGSSGSSSYPTVGSTKEVAYNPQQPQEAKVVDGIGSKLLMGLFIALGAAIFILSPVFYLRSKRRDGSITNLVQSGVKLNGMLVDITSFSNNSYKLTVSAADPSGQVQTYVSDTLMGIGGLAMADYRSNPVPIDVYINPSNPQEYYVDVSDVPNLTPERIAALIQQAAQSVHPGNSQLH